MTKINKALIVPVLALIALIIKQVYNINVSETYINEGADVVLGIISAIGFFMHPKSKVAQVEAIQAVETVVKEVAAELPPAPVSQFPAGEKPAIPPN